MAHYQEIIINTDGGARGNPGPAAIGITAQADSQTIFEISEYIGHQTNNVAEYTAVIHALNHLRDHGLTADKVRLILDSELIVRQITGVYRVKEPHLQILAGQIRELLGTSKSGDIVKTVKFEHVLRGKNRRADQLVNQALDSHK